MPNVIFNNNSSFKSALKTPAHKATQNLMPVKSGEKSEKTQNNGGLVGGLGYFFEKIGVGFMQSVEGIWDYTAGGIADLFGADQWAEEQFANDWFGDWYSHPDEWFNPSGGWKFVGDVAAGIGTSLPALGTVGASVVSGGTLSPLAAGIISGGVAGLGAAGGATKEAYLETGKLDGAAYAYGALSGATEAGLEIATGLAGKGTGRLIKNLANKGAKEISEAAVKKTGKALLKQLGEDFVSEAFEEGFSEFITPYYKRMTYDTNAQNASLEEIGYAALVGGFSGMLMSGTSAAASSAYDGIKGGNLVKKNRTDAIINAADGIAEAERKSPSGDEVRENLVKVLDEFKESVGEERTVSTFKQKQQLARLDRSIVAAAYTPFIYRSAAKIVNDVDSVVERLNSYGYKDKNGNPIVYTKEQLTAGVDFRNRKSIAKALKTNDSLRMLAISDAIGNLMLDTDSFVTTTLEGNNLATTDDLNQFAERAKPENFEALSKALDITPDEWRTMTPEIFSEKFDVFYKSKYGAEYMRKGKLINEVRAIPESSAKTKTPSTVRTVKDGITRYKTETLDFAIIKNSDSINFYDYQTNHLTRDFTVGEAQKLLNAIKSEKMASLTPANVEKSTENEQKIAETGNFRHAFNQKTLEQMDNYRKRIDAWDGKTEGFAFVMGDAPAYLSELEVSGKKIGKKQVRIDATKIKSIMGNHSEMTRDVIKNLPYLLNEPILVLDSKTVQGRLVLLGEVYANGKPVMMALEINPSTRSGSTTYVDVIKIASAYVRTNTQNLINNSNIRYIDKNKSRVNDWLKVNRLQLPLPNSQSNSATNSIIPENSQKINTLGKKSAKIQEKSANAERKTVEKGKKVEASISDEWRIMTPELFSSKFNSFYKSKFGMEYMRKGKLINEIKAIPESAAKTKTPSAVRTVKDGITRYKTDALDFAIVKDGNSIIFYDYQTNHLTRDFTVGEAQKLLNAINDNALTRNYERERSAIEINEDNTPFVVVEQDILKGVPETDWIKTVKSNLASKFPNGVPLGNNTVNIDRQSRKEMTFSKYMQWLKKNNPQAFSDKLRATNNVDEILNATQDWTSEGLKHPRQDSITDFSRGSVLLRIGNNDYTAAVVVGTMKNGKMILYDIIDLVATKIIKKETGGAIPENSSRRAERKTTPISNNSIPENSQKINTFGKKSAEIQEKSANAERKTVEKGKKVEASISDELKAAGEFAEANVPEYKELSVPNKRAVRKTIIQAKAEGMSDADTTTFARFSAKSGINLSFDKSKLITDADENGNVKYSDGMYDGNNTIYVNKDSSRKYSSLLFHELTHFLFKNAPDKLTHSLLKQAVVNMAAERRNAIVEAYSAFYGTKVDTVKLIDIINDEWFAHYTEDVLTDIDVLSFLDSKKPTLKEAIVRFFSRSANEYKGVEQLSSAARKYATKYRKLFNQIAELNQQNISSATDIKPLTRINQENMHVTGNNEGLSDATNTDERFAIKFLSEEDLPGYLRAGGRANKYKQQAIDEGKKIIITTPEDVREYIQKSIAGEKDLPTVAYGKVDIKLSEETSDYSDGSIQISNYYLELVATDIRHAYQEHLHAKEKGDIDLSVEDFMNIPLYVATYDDFVYATKYKSGNTKICLSKKISDGRVLVIETVSKSHGSIEFKNMIGVSEEKYLEEYEKRYKKRNGTNTGGSKSSNNSPRDETASNTSIPENSQKSNTFDKKTSEIFTDSRQALPETADSELTKSGISEGEKRKIVADYTRSVVYSRKAFVDTLKSVPGGLDLKPSTFKKYVDRVWENANTLTSHKDKLNFAHDIAVQIVDSIISEGAIENPDAVEAKERLAHLRSGLNRLTFDKSDMSEIKYHADKSGARRLLARWGYKKRGTAQYQPYYMEQFVNDIASELPGMSDLKEMHPAEAFIAINDLYERAVEEAGEKLTQKYIESTDSERIFMITGIENSLMRAFRVKSEKSKFYKHVEQNVNRYKEQAEHWKTKYDNDKGRNRVLGWLIGEAKKMKDKKLGTFANATQWKMDEFKGTIEKLSRIEFRENFNESGTRKILGELSTWYVKDNPMLSESEFDGGIAEMLKQLSKEPENGPKQLTVPELKLLYQVMRYFNHFIENYNKVWRNGKWIEALPEAKRYVEQLHETKKDPPGFIRRQINKYFETFADPESVVKAMDNYKSGFFTEVFYELREAAKNADVEEMNVKRQYDMFISDNKEYLSRAIGEEIDYRGVKIPKIKLIGLYLTLGREHSHAGFLYNGFTFTDKGGNRVNADGAITADTNTLSDAELLAYAKAERTKIWELMSKADRQYASILEYAFNSECKQLKIERDMQRFGYSNATNEYYYPIKRADTAKNVDSTDIAEDIDHVTNSSFNKNTVTGSSGRLYIESADLVFNRHVKAVCMYAHLTPAIEAYNKLYNMDISGNRNKPVSVATESANVWKNGNTYFKNLISDIQGLPRNSDEPGILKNLRGGYAKFQLGANPKVWATQFSSLFAASSILDMDCIIRGVGIKSKDIATYCPLAELRQRDNSAARAQGVLDKVDKVGNLLMKPIGMMDNLVINKLYGACQAQIEKNGVAKVGTTANKRAAGELLTKVILGTQQNSLATERSGAMRSGSEIMRTLTMFSADSMKVIGRVFDAVGQLNAYKAELKKAKEKATLSFTTEPTTEYGEGIRYKGHLFQESISNNPQKVKVLHRKSFSQQVDDVINGTHNPVYDLYIGETPSVLRNIGFDDKPLLMRNSKIKEILDKHKEMTVEFIKKIPDAISDPVMILKSKSNPDESVVVITDIMTSAGEMIIPIWVSQNGNYFDVEFGKSISVKANFVASAYGRSVKGLIEYAFNNNEVLFVAENKNRVSRLLATHGLQLPARLLIANSINSISQNQQKNNTFSEKSFENDDELIEKDDYDTEISVLEGKIKDAKLQARKAINALLLSALYMATIAASFRWLLAKEDDEPWYKTFAIDAFGNLFGGLPIIRDISGRILEGYGFDNYAYSAVNDLLDTSIYAFDAIGKMVAGEAKGTELARSIKNLINAAGQIVGIPTRNIYNYLYGLTKRVSPTTAYKIDNIFYDKNYRTDLYKALERNDADMASMLISMLYKENISEDLSDTLHDELYELTAAGYKVLPRSVDDTLKYNGEEIEIDEDEREAIRSKYAEHIKSVEALVSLKQYQRLSDEEQAEAIKHIYDLYYDSAIESTFGIPMGNTVLIAKVIPAQHVALLSVATKGIESDKDSAGKTIAGTKRKKVISAILSLDLSTEEKLFLIAAKGYSIKDGDIPGMTAEKAKKKLLAYILKLKLSKAEREEIAVLCGFEVKNGKVTL